MFEKIKTYNKYKVFASVGAVVVGLDQLTKALARKFLQPGVRQTFIPDVLDFQLIHNPGAAWGLGSGKRLALIIFAAAVFGGSIYLLRKVSKLPKSLVVCLSAVACGGISNAIDRIYPGEVTDFLSLAFVNFPVFNIADIAISVGCVAGFILFMIWDDGRENAS